jgi:hypothetical protein
LERVYHIFGLDGNPYPAPNLETIQRWVREGRVTRDCTVELPDGRMMRASAVPGLRFGEGPPVAPPPPGYGIDPPMIGPPIPTHLGKAIFACLCACLPLGVLAVVFAAQVPSLERAGRRLEAEAASARASAFANWSFGLTIALFLAWLALAASAGGT